MNVPMMWRSRPRTIAGALLALALIAGTAAAQTDTTAALPDTAAVAAPVAPVRHAAPRASWLSDRMPLGPGDLVTVVVDEQTAARERVSRVADGNRTMNNRLRLDTPTGAQGAALQSASLTNSRDVGEAGRTGDLTAVLTVRVVEVESTGALRIHGTRKVSVDGRLQDITLDGVVRAEDVDGSNRVLSSRIGDAVITYKGGKIGPRTGILGKVLGMLWP
jgi:flagellar L-ring protein precursor FlgH